MKTKYNVLALVEIVVVLYSVFLVALPSTTIATEEDDYVLGIYGNANEDDTIDMRDLTYVKLIFFGKKPETELADAKYDGKINPLDFIQIKLIIVGKEKELTIVDSADRIVTVKKPVERILALTAYVPQTTRSFKLEKDKIVGIIDRVADDDEYFPEISKLPSVGKRSTPDYEAILSLNPDLVIGVTWQIQKHAEKLPGIIAVGFNLYRASTHVDETRKLGYILDKEEEADEYLGFYNGVLNTIKETVDEIPEEDRPKVYWEVGKPYYAGGGGSSYEEKIELAGGKNIFEDTPGGHMDVDAEEVIKRNPEIIVFGTYPSKVGGTKNGGVDLAKLIDSRNEVMNRPELAKVEAVKNGKVYITFGDPSSGLRGNFVGIAYKAKWFNPELFEDLDPKAIHHEYLTRFQGLPDDFLDTHGAFVYHPEVNPDGH